MIVDFLILILLIAAIALTIGDFRTARQARGRYRADIERRLKAIDLP